MIAGGAQIVRRVHCIVHVGLLPKLHNSAASGYDLTRDNDIRGVRIEEVNS